VTAGRTIVVLQARLGSQRLPGKVLADLAGRTVLAHCVRRLQVAAVGPVVVATTTLGADDAVAAEAERLGVTAFRGETDDVLARFVAAAAAAGAEYVVRATGDNPAVDLLTGWRLIEALRRQHADHAVETGLPYGCTAEAVKTSALVAAAERATAAADREHVTTYIRSRPAEFRCLVQPCPRSVRRPDLRFTIDTAEDLAYMREVFRRAGDGGRLLPPLETLIAAAAGVPAVQPGGGGLAARPAASVSGPALAS
jgi:spore coat polysaccharide biosynthesis protein SpsF (cytidylyltransferase family)